MRTRRSACLFLVGFLGVTLAAVVFRVDHWPLTWVPMYAAYEPTPEYPVRVWDREEVLQGLRLTRLDGGTEYVNHKRLNIPRTKFIRLYYERMYGQGPPKEDYDHQSLSSMNRRLREAFGGTRAAMPSWEWRILYALNKSLGREPGQPGFIVAVEASVLERRFSIQDLNDGGGVRPLDSRRTARAVWRNEWLQQWARDDI